MRRLETTVDLLDALQERHGWESDRQIAIGLGVPTTTVSSWRRRAAYPTEVHAFTIAKALDMEPLHVLAIAAADRSPDKKTREEWLRQIARVVAALAVGTGALSTGYTPPAEAAGPGVYIPLNRRRKRSAAPIAA